MFHFQVVDALVVGVNPNFHCTLSFSLVVQYFLPTVSQGRWWRFASSSPVDIPTLSPGLCMAKYHEGRRSWCVWCATCRGGRSWVLGMVEGVDLVRGSYSSLEDQSWRQLVIWNSCTQELKLQSHQSFSFRLVSCDLRLE